VRSIVATIRPSGSKARAKNPVSVSDTKTSLAAATISMR